MKQMRQVLMWAVLIGIGLLTILSIVGSFLGDQRASALFNSIPLVIFWILLAALLVAGLIYFKRLIRSPGMLAAHLGTLLILVGAMIGSDGGHALATKLFNSKKVPKGYMQIFEGQVSNGVWDGTGKIELTKLPFSIGLKDFRIEYYDVDEPWELIVESGAVEKGGHQNKWIQEQIKWTKGQEVAIPFTNARLEVLQYFQSARPTYSDNVQPVLEITLADGKKATLIAQLGQKLLLKDPQLSVEVVQVFTTLRVMGTGKGRVVNVEGPAKNPAVRVHIEHADGKKTHQYVYARTQVHDQEDAQLKFRYLFAEPDAAEPDPSSHLPAMEILIKHKEKSHRAWLIVPKHQSYARLSLVDLLGLEQKDDHGEHAHQKHLSLYLNKVTGQISDYKSDLVVQDEGHTVHEKTIEVNDPLHYGGYHFYQNSYGQSKKDGRWYTGLSVTSDSGLILVYIGFALMVGGMFWLFWVKPTWGYLRKWRSDAV